MNNYYLGLYEKALPISLNFKEKLNAAKKCGFDFLEISIDETDEKLSRLDWTKQQIWDLRKICYQVDLPICTMCLSGNRKYPIGSTHLETSNRGIEIICKAIDFASELGIRIVQVAGYDVYYGEESTHLTSERFYNNLKKCTKYAAIKGIILALETMENDFMNTVEKAMYYVNEINSPYLKVYPDIGNLTNGSNNITKDVRCGKGNIVAAHLKETKPGIFRDVLFGTGQVDFAMVIDVLKSQDVNIFTAEFWHDGEDDWMEKTKKVHEFLIKKLDNTEGAV